MEWSLNARVCSKLQLGGRSLSAGLLGPQPSLRLGAAEGNQPWLSAGQQGPPAEPVFSLPCLKDTFACVTSVWAFWLLTH